MWTSDGSPELSISNGPTVSCFIAEQTQSSIYNALWKDNGDDGLQTGKAYWKITCESLEDGIFVGISDLEKFKKGWAFKGLLYGGNLSDGGCLLVGNFGPCPKSGDVVGIFVDADDSTIKVYFDINGRPLGLAFDVPRSTLGRIFPVLHFSNSGKASIVKSDVFPKIAREEETFEGLVGNWEYSSGPFDASGERRVTFQVRGESGNNIGYHGSLRVLNTIGISLEPTGNPGQWRGTTGFSTLMGGSPEMMQLESEITHHATGTYSLNADGNLTITNGDKTSVWKRYIPSVATVTKNPFNNVW